MTGPTDPGDDDPGFPQVEPASTELPPAEEPVYDTGSDAWWRAQADAQRTAAASEPVVAPEPPPPPAPVPPPELVEPTVLNAPSPLDEAWVPPELPELRPPDPEPEAQPEPEPEPGWDDAPHDEDAWDDATTAYAVDEPPPPPAPAESPDSPDWFRGLVDPATAVTAAAPMPAETPVEPQEEPRERPPYDGERVGPARALAGAGLALLGVLLAIGALIVFNGNDEPKGGPIVAGSPSRSAEPSTQPSTRPSTRPSTQPSTRPTATAPAVVVTTPPAQAPVVPVSVLNNSRRTGLADAAAKKFRAGGWPVPTTGNYTGRISTTTVYYDAGQEASAQRFARQFGIPRVLPRSALPGIPTSGMTVVLTRDYQP